MERQMNRFTVALEIAWWIAVIENDMNAILRSIEKEIHEEKMVILDAALELLYRFPEYTKISLNVGPFTWDDVDILCAKLKETAKG